MSTTVVSASDAARHLGDLLARIRYRRETFLIRRGRTIVARLGPATAPPATGADLARRWREMPHLDTEDARAFERDLAAGRRTVRRATRDPWAG
jgi:antitoxin (DNA-binding transcriptional repressor) of toxin-antitoxin stability system